MEYMPDGWMLVEISGTDPHYRVFGSWRGGYLDGDAWRMNSGIVRCEKEGKMYKFYGSSGSCYMCHESGYGNLGSYNHGVLSQYEARSGGKLQAIPFLPDGLVDYDWKI